MTEQPKRLIDVLGNPALLMKLLGEYFSFQRWRRQEPINDRGSLKRFLDTRASFVGQYSLYGYLRTRAGMRYPELFDDDPFVVSINIAKWHIWLACLSDLAIYTGGFLYHQPGANERDVSGLMQQVVDEILDETGVPEEAGDEFAAHAGEVRKRIASSLWHAVTDNEAPFSESPEALVRWAPVVQDLKEVDADIVKNSIRFRWQKVRRDLRDLMDADALFRATTR